jgi:hypothetical protein
MVHTSGQDDSHPTASMPKPTTESLEDHGPTASTDADQMSSYGSSRSGSASEGEGPRKPSQKMPRPKLHTRKSSGTIIVPRDDPNIEPHEEHYDEGDARTMSPRRSSEEVERLEEGARQTMIECVVFNLFLVVSLLTLDSQAKALQASLLDIVERVESVKAEHEKLEGGNKFLQSYVTTFLTDSCSSSLTILRYIGELMQTSKITSSGGAKNKGKGRATK